MISVDYNIYYRDEENASVIVGSSRM